MQYQPLNSIFIHIKFRNGDFFYVLHLISYFFCSMVYLNVVVQIYMNLLPRLNHRLAKWWQACQGMARTHSPPVTGRWHWEVCEVRGSNAKWG